MSKKKKKIEDMTPEEMEEDGGFQDFMEDLENQPICLNCNHCVYIGEGDSICDADREPYLIMADWGPTDEYWWCNGSEYENMYDEED